MMKREPLAVVGVSALFPGTVDATGFWNDILSGTDRITEVPPSHWLLDDFHDDDPSVPDKTYASRGAFLDPTAFDAMGWGIPPTLVPATDTSQLLSLIVAQKVLDDATRGQWASADKDRTSVILGVTSAQTLLGEMVSRLQHPIWRKSLRDAGLPESKVNEVVDRISNHYTPWVEGTFPGLLGNVVAGRIANRLDLGGTNCVTDAACASAFSALKMGAQELWLGDSDMVVTGGVDCMNDIFMYMCFSKTPALSRSGDCRPFSDAADGTMLGEGLGMVALKRLSDAQAAGDRIYAVLRGVGSSSDGRAKSVYAPLASGQAKALRRAYDEAGYGPDTVELVEAHGTGTKAGDAAEFEGLRTVFEESGREDRQWCAVGTVKAQIGHTKATAGAAGLIKAVFALHHKTLPPQAKVDAPNPALKIADSPFDLNTRAKPWIRGSSHPRRAGVSSFGFGGSNFHLTLEEAAPSVARERLRTLDVDLVALSGEPTEMARKARELAKLAATEACLARLAFETTRDFSPAHTARLLLVVADEAALIQRLTAAAERIDSDPTGAWSSPDGSFYGVGAHQGQVGFLFPGQGSQTLDMGSAPARHFDAARGAWDESADLDLGEGLALHQVVFPSTVFSDEARTAQADRLTATRWAQPALGVASLALLRLVTELGLTPSAVAGHSFGELTALHAAGVYSADDLVRIARCRGELMESAGDQPGAMSAVRAGADAIAPHLAGEPVVMANHNHPKQTVISGPTDSVARVEVKLDAAGLRCQRLGVATAFHSEVVAGASKPFGKFLGGVKFKKPSVPVYANATAAPYPKTAKQMRAQLAGQIAQPVRFVALIEAMRDQGVTTFVEVGPGSVLTGLVGRILKGDKPLAVALDAKGSTGIKPLFTGLAKLAAAGLPLQLHKLWAEYRTPDDFRLRVKPKLAMHLQGSNYGRPYPPPGGAADLPPPNPEVAPTPAPAPSLASAPKEVAVAADDRSKTPPQPQPAPVAAAPQQPVYAATPTPSAAGAVALPGNAHLAWVQAFQEAQRQTAEAHAAWQSTMSQAHSQFLQTAQTQMMGLATMMNPGLAAPQPVYAAPAPVYAAPAPVYAAPPMPAPAPVAPAPVIAAPAPVAAAPAPVAAAPAPVATAPAAVAEPDLDLNSLLLDVVAEKTGYPADMLNLEMNLEGDLGIDSIKRVEILSTMQERAPGLPEVDAGAMATLTTLGQIVAYMQSQLPAGATSAAPPVTAASPALDLNALLLDVVAEKTGYPADMLNLEMNLEGDLGIDSIKRVEILSTMQERAPGLPEVDAGAMATLTTLGQIVDYMQSQLSGAGVAEPSPAVASAPTPAPAVAPPPAPAEDLDLSALLLEVVAEKTGYPADMLALEMSLEGDLGIDSIKRVEILSTMQERAPSLPEVDAAAMATLTTLGAVVDHMTLALGGTVAPTPSATSATVDPLGRFALEAVEAPPMGLSGGHLPGKARVAVTGDGTALSRLLVEELNIRGVNAELVVEVPADATGLIVLEGLAPIDDTEQAANLNREAFQAVRSFDAAGRNGGLLVTVQDTGGKFGLGGGELGDRAWLAGMAALARTASLEWTVGHARAIDLERGERSDQELAELLADELLTGGPELEVGLTADGRRWTLTDQPAPLGDGDEQGINLGADDVIVVTGGARGVTAACVIAVALQTKARFALLGRTKLTPEPACVATATDDATIKRALLTDARSRGVKVTPAELGWQARHILAGREVRETLSAVKATGGDARYISTDVTDRDAIDAALEAVRTTWGPVTGLVHGAGVLADKKIGEKSDSDFDKVFRTKVQSLQALLDATADEPLKLLCLFSSIAARSGNQGQADYAMANEVLNKVARAETLRRGPGCRVASMGWGPWEGGMVTPALKARFESLGVPLIPLNRGCQMLVDEVFGHSKHPEVVLGGRPKPLREIGEGVLEVPLRINAETHPYLADHSVEGVPVVPVVLVLEWFHRLAKAFRPDLTLETIQDLKVLKGIQVPDFQGEGLKLMLRCKQLSNGDGALLALELRGDGDRPHYSATAELTRHDLSAAPVAPTLELDAWGDRQVYGGTLFHGPDFQVIRKLEGVSAEGIAGELDGLLERGWSHEPWHTDPAALDGGLQLALLWTEAVLGGRSLPTSVEAVHTYTTGPAEGPLRCVLTARETGRSKAKADVLLVDSAGKTVASLIGVETHLYS